MSYQVRQISKLFCYLIAPISGEKSMRALRVTKIVTEIKFEEVLRELETRKVSTDKNSQNI